MIYDYTDNGIPDALVDTESEYFLDRVQWIMRNSPAISYSIIEYTGSTWGSSNTPSHSVTRALVQFAGPAGQYSAHDAYLLQCSPEVTLVGIYSDFGMQAPNPVPQFDDSVEPETDPVGPPWPEKGSNIWHVSAQYVASAWPQGSQFTRNVEGLDRTFTRTSVRGKSAPSGTVGGSATYVPAWTA